jgi:SAM-dependent methyltransferase
MQAHRPIHRGLDEEPFAALLTAAGRKVWRRLRLLAGRGSGRFVWSSYATADATGPAFNVRTYQERRQVRDILRGISAKRPLRRAAEIGCGYGRLTMVLLEFCSEAVGFEREPHLVAIARELLPDATFRTVNSLDRLNSPDGHFDFAFTFTVLQHLDERGAAGAVAEIKRIVAPGGYVLLVEKTNPSQTVPPRRDGFVSIGRPVDVYERWMAPWTLAAVVPRRVEPTYAVKEVGSYMLFSSSQ